MNKRYLPLLVGWAATFLPLVIILVSVMNQTGGVFSYPVDDAYIHMQIARNLAEHGVWGINPNEFGSASSSPLYTLILGLLSLIFSSHYLIPLVVNSIAGILLVAAVQRWLQKENLGMGLQIVFLLLFVFLLPLPLVILSGMEHTLQCLFSFLFVYQFSSWMEGRGTGTGTGTGTGRGIPIQLIVYGMLAVSIRYEDIFLLALACLILFFRRRFTQGFLLGLLVMLPLILFGIYSVAKGSYFLPNSVLVKSEAAQFSIGGMATALGNILQQKFLFAYQGISLLATQKLLLLLPLCLLAAINYLKEKRSYTYILVILTGTVFLHIALADTGKFYRYEAYLICLSLPVIFMVLFQWGRTQSKRLTLISRLVFLFILILLLLPVVLRSVIALSKTRQSCINIYEQQYQMGRFLKTFHNNEVVAAYDIGAISYFTNCRIVDLWGLANIEVARSKKGGYWTAPFLDSLVRSKGGRMAIIYDSWIGSSIPPSWQKIGSWTIQNNVVCGDDTVFFYSVDSTRAAPLKKNLLDYQKMLPATVQVKYYY